ncbi:hypothetical protein EJB05_09845, partial [Eragrostis curvula]
RRVHFSLSSLASPPRADTTLSSSSRSSPRTRVTRQRGHLNPGELATARLPESAATPPLLLVPRSSSLCRPTAKYRHLPHLSPRPRFGPPPSCVARLLAGANLVHLFDSYEEGKPPRARGSANTGGAAGAAEPVEPQQVNAASHALKYQGLLLNRSTLVANAASPWTPSHLNGAVLMYASCHKRQDCNARDRPREEASLPLTASRWVRPPLLCHLLASFVYHGT